MLVGALGFGMLVARPKLDMIRPLAAFGLSSLLLVSPWLIRNWTWTGNPVFPLALNVLGPGHFTPKQVERFTVAHKAPPRQASVGGRFQALDAEIIRNAKFGYVLWGLMLASTVLAWRDPRARMLICAFACIVIVWLLATHLIGRFFVMAIPIALCAIALPSERALRIAGAAALPFVLIFATLGYMQPLLDRFLPLADQGLYGMVDIKSIDPPILDSWRMTDQPLYKVGDAQAYQLQAAPGMVKYRSPFDVDDSVGDGLQAWLGKDVDRAKVWILIDPPELQRLHDTYGTPVPDVAKGRAEPFVIAPGGAK
jgi:hypothetical protein